MSARVPSVGTAAQLGWSAVPLAIALAAGLAYVGGSRPSLALLAAFGILVVGGLAADMAFLPVLAFPCMYMLFRVGGTLSMSDFVLFLATLCALIQVRTRESPELQRLLWVVVFYQASLLPTLLQNRYLANYIEWCHELFLVGGSLIIGWVVGRAGKARAAVALYVVPACLLALSACLLAPVEHFHPFNLLIFQKNAMGDIFAFTAVIAYARPHWLGWRPWVSNFVLILCGLGTLAAHSRQGMVSIVVGVVVLAVRGHVLKRRSRVILLAMIPLAVVAYVATVNQISSGNKFDSTHQRLTWYGQSLDIWHHSVVVGVGLRWWYTGRWNAGFQPPNAELEMLTSAGLIGLMGFLGASFAAIWILWRMDPRYGTVAAAIVIVRLVQGQLDLYWVASQSSLPWLIVGLAVGAQALHRHTDPGERAVKDHLIRRPVGAGSS